MPTFSFIHQVSFPAIAMPTHHVKNISRVARVLLLLLLLIPFSFKGYTQCVGFAKSIAKPLLGEYVHDGNYSAAILGEGESAEVYKTFFSNQQYRLVVAGIESLPKIRVVVTDMNKKVLFDNARHNFAKIWDFQMETTQKLIVRIKILEDQNPAKIKGGCVAILFGVQRD